ncbi:hypothetical protein G1H11_15625 [Phytoactinopolyspora alkaliphila]|uniref:Uncharacterized protein n=1 Tax=Phytoactinopolyspora alkaliphila TaxID=1783498 RepID=A0A6N9YPI9_9ACTN|nr:hypothetical protein [Phytoactinopolyspora alkaliphila]NED96739.1 hypothetical protein [Phytoactinopolyspora alkaliphila]
MNRTTRRVLRTELLRGAAPVAAAGVLLAGFLIMGAFAGDWAGWSGRWTPLAASVRLSLMALGALVAAAAAWQAGRERRRRTSDQIGSTSRPGWQPFVVGWASVTLGSSVAMLVVVGACAALVAPVASYGGGGWVWMIVVAFPGLAALSALGALLGRLIPSRLVAPVVAVAVYLPMVGVVDGAGPGVTRWLAPVLSPYDAPGYTIDAAVSLAQFVWFSAVAGTAIMLIVTAQRWLIVVPAGIAVGAAAWLASSSPQWEVDRAAVELVCTEDGSPEVCLTRLNSFLLDDVAPLARGALAHWEGIPGAPDRAVDETAQIDHWDAEDEASVRLTLTSGATLSGGYAGSGARSPHGWEVIDWWPATTCAGAVTEQHWSLFEVATAWGIQADAWLEPDSQRYLDALMAMPAKDQKNWMGRFLAAAETCDESVLATLAEELR